MEFPDIISQQGGLCLVLVPNAFKYFSAGNFSVKPVAKGLCTLGYDQSMCFFECLCQPSAYV